MREHLGFLKTSGIVVKIAACLCLLFGIIGGVSVLLGYVEPYPRWMGLIVLGVYTFLFFFLFLIAKIADLLVKIINEIKKE